MKKILIYTIFSVAYVFLFSSSVFADVIPLSSHVLTRCSKVVNLKEFPDVILIGYITGPMSDKKDIYQIKDNECLTKGYKFNSLSIYWSTKEEFNSIDIKDLNLADMNLLLENIDPQGGYISDSNPLVKEDIEYSIGGFSDNKLIFYKSKQTSEYNNGKPIKIETFNSPMVNQEIKNQKPQPNKITASSTPTPQVTPIQSDISVVSMPTPEPVEGGFWKSVFCFFGGLFGKRCN